MTISVRVRDNKQLIVEAWFFWFFRAKKTYTLTDGIWICNKCKIADTDLNEYTDLELLKGHK